MNIRIKNFLICVGFLGAATTLAFLFFIFVPESSANIALLYMLSLVLIARFTTGYLSGLLSGIFCVVCINYLFTYPYFALNFTLTGYPVTFLVMLAINFLTSTTTSHQKYHEKLLQERERLRLNAEKENMRANLLRAVSHDLRTPLTSIIGASTSCLENTDKLSEEEKANLLSHIVDDANWLLHMVENLLSVTRIQGDYEIITSLEPVEEVVSEAVCRIRQRIPDLAITVSVPEELLMIPMDPILIEQVLLNLMENAYSHGNGSHPIECTVCNDKENAIFTVKDYGKGIDEDNIDALFDGADSSDIRHSDAKKGIGIGLSICKTILMAHHGTIYAYNHDKGASFVFTLPKGEM